MDNDTKQTGLMRFAIGLILLLLSIEYTYCQSRELSYFLPPNVSYDSCIAPPGDMLGFQVGEFHVTHDRLVSYLQYLAEKSDRINIETIGYTYEKRPLIFLTISSPSNLRNISKIKSSKDKYIYATSDEQIEPDSIPLVIWMGYSIHGNEPSGSNAALLLAYYLAAAQGDEIDQLLSSSIIIIDPCSNPDGLQRYSAWVNSFHSKNPVGDVNDIEFMEPWPQGRTNHYWFDLNRDWLLLQQPESKARIKKYHEWKPNVITDHHEMGINSTLFFQPGVPSRKNPLTPSLNEKLTIQLSEYHANALDKQQELYFTKEGFDDYYFGKGSTYPDLNGGVGILFEQGSSRGQIRETENGLRDFASTIKNQFTISLSTIHGGHALKNEFISYQKEFYQDAKSKAESDQSKAIVIGAKNDFVKLNQLTHLLLEHEIEIYKPKKVLSLNEKIFDPDKSYIIPYSQPQYLLLKALFEKRTSFKDSLFYDVSSWTMDLAFDVDFETLDNKFYSEKLLGDKITSIKNPSGHLISVSDYGYAAKWGQYYTPAALYQLLKNDLFVKVSESGFTDQKGNVFPSGSIIIPMGLQSVSKDRIEALLDSIAHTYHIDFYSLESGKSNSGIDLGSPQISTLKKPSILLVVGEGVDANEAGEIWQLLDQKMNIPVSLVPIDKMTSRNLNRYTTIIFPGGNYNGFNIDAIKNWLKNGGTIIAQNNALRWLKNKGVFLGNFKPLESQEILQISYNQRKKYKGAHSLGGAIFQTKIDTSHPLCFGYQEEDLAVFKNSKIWLDQTFLSFNNPVIFTNTPLLSGFISDKNLGFLRNTSGVVIHAYGNGKVIGFAFNPNFRGYWYGTEKLFLNSIFFGSIINTQF